MIYVLVILLQTLGANSLNSTLGINSTALGQTTTVPPLYRGIIGVALVILLLFIGYKFLRLLVSALFVVIILLIIASTAYYFLKYGAFSVSYSTAFLYDVYTWFANGRLAQITGITTVMPTVPTTSVSTTINATAANIIANKSS
ncbi:MAG: hypothetical protein QXH69_01025 [Candidatus Micrarchaeaceae archaeon]